MINPPWLDAPDALERIDSAAVPEDFKRAARALVVDGLAVVRGAHDPALCRRVVDDYRRYVDENQAYARSNLDALGHEKRLVNFHVWSSSAAEVGTNPRLMQLLDFLFGMEACVYTSLLFKYGTQQPVHRDTPHFATWPRGYFFGVWTALQDIDPDSGPVFYHRGAHRYHVDERRFQDEARTRKPDASEADQHLLALDLYYGEVIRRSPAEGPVEIPKLSSGDVVIWHPELPHGGSPAKNPELTRWSMVFHCTPVAVQVYQHTDFFGHAGTEPPPPRYGYTTVHGRKIAAMGGPGFM